jgi:hypothetical protein
MTSSGHTVYFIGAGATRADFPTAPLVVTLFGDEPNWVCFGSRIHSSQQVALLRHRGPAPQRSISGYRPRAVPWTWRGHRAMSTGKAGSVSLANPASSAPVHLSPRGLKQLRDRRVSILSSTSWTSGFPSLAALATLTADTGPSDRPLARVARNIQILGAGMGGPRVRRQWMVPVECVCASTCYDYIIEVWLDGPDDQAKEGVEFLVDQSQPCLLKCGRKTLSKLATRAHAWKTTGGLTTPAPPRRGRGHRAGAPRRGRRSLPG